MVSYYVKKTTMTYLTMIWHLFDTIIIVSIDKEWLYWSVKV